VERVRSGFADVVDLCSRLTAILSAKGIGDHRGFGYVIRTKRVIAGSRLVVEVVRFDDVRTVHGKENRVEGQTVDIEICIASTHVETETWSSKCNVGDIPTIYRRIFNILLRVRGDGVPVSVWI
jgi:hypothetical protein